MTQDCEQKRLLQAGVAPAHYRRMCKADEHRLCIALGILTALVTGAMLMCGLAASALFALMLGALVTIALPPLALAEPSTQISEYDAAWSAYTHANKVDPGVRAEPL